jgi:hypothetical protein
MMAAFLWGQSTLCPRLQGVHSAQDQRVVRRHHGKVDLLLFGKGGKPSMSLAPMGTAGGILRYAAVAGQG